MTTASTARTNWLGIASTVGLFVWFLFWLKNEPQSAIGQILCWGPLILIHWLGIEAARRPLGWVYILPLGLFWLLAIIAICGGIPT